MTTILENNYWNPWGLIVDPKTNDIFVTDVDSSASLSQFAGFPPGMDFGVVVGNINTKLTSALAIINEVRRDLKEAHYQILPLTETESGSTYASENGRVMKTRFLKQSKGPKPANGPTPAKAPKKGKGSGGGGGGSTETTIPTVEEIAAAIIANGASEVTTILNTIINNPSFQTNVLSGGDSTTFLANLDTVKTSISTLASSEGAAITDTAKKATFDALIAEILALLDLMKSAVEIP